jgi:5'-deoxynucleotidase YfbR-like HD superfamily hydrolase
MANLDPILPALQDLIVRFSQIDRNHYLSGTNRRENDSEHSLTVAVLCWYIHDKHKLDLDIGRILKYAIAHDFVEVYAGDINAFASPEDRAKKVILEQESLARLSEEFKDFPDLVEVMEGYESKTDEEALFVWTVDKIQALVLGDLDNWRPYEELRIDFNAFCAKYESTLAQASPYIKHVFEDVLAYYKTTYYDQKDRQPSKSTSNR